MKKINHNRLIGGAVLVLVALFFVPVILNPANKSSDKSGSGVVVTMPKKASSPDTNEENPPSKKQELKLTSLDNKPAMVNTENASTPHLQKRTPTDVVGKTEVPPAHQTIPIKLESLDNNSSVATLKRHQPSREEKPQKRPAKKESWIRVGSFSNLANANKFADTLKHQKYPVKIETTHVSGKRYQRVLIGPFYSEDKMKVVLEQMKAAGVRPNIQH